MQMVTSLPPALMIPSRDGFLTKVVLTSLFHAVYRTQDNIVVAIFQYAEDCTKYIEARAYPENFKVIALT